MTNILLFHKKGQFHYGRTVTLTGFIVRKFLFRKIQNILHINENSYVKNKLLSN